MALLNVQAVAVVYPYVKDSEDSLVISVIVSDADGNPVTDLAVDDFTLVNDGSIPTDIQAMGHGTLMVSLYNLSVTAGPAPAHFENAMGPLAVLVSNGTDHGQALVLVDIEGRPYGGDD